MKFCKDCKWSKENKDWPQSINFSNCFHPKNIDKKSKIDKFFLVSEKNEPILELNCPTCIRQREHNWLEALMYGRCGKSGRWFEAKE